MPEWLKDQLSDNKGGTVAIVVTVVVTGYVAGWAWGIAFLCAVIALLWGIALAIPTKEWWSRHNGRKILVGAIVYTILFGVVAYYVHGWPWV